MAIIVTCCSGSPKFIVVIFTFFLLFIEAFFVYYYSRIQFLIWETKCSLPLYLYSKNCYTVAVVTGVNLLVKTFPLLVTYVRKESKYKLIFDDILTEEINLFHQWRSRGGVNSGLTKKPYFSYEIWMKMDFK